MEIVYQLMMAVSLAACTGCRTWLPLFAVGIMARTSHVELNPAFHFLSSNTMLIIFGIASVLEFLGDKVIAIDHLLDVVGTFARPAAGTILSSSLLTKVDAPTALLLGLIAGAAPSLTVHAAKAVTRVKVSAFAPLHGGAANAAASFVEDVVSSLGIVVALMAPVVAFVLVLVFMSLAVIVIYLGVKSGIKLYRLLLGAGPANAPTNSMAA